MKPLFNCPYCGNHLKYHKYTPTWYDKYCSDHCPMEYHQNFLGNDKTPEEEWELAYIHLYTKRYFMDIFFDKGYYPNDTYVYSHAEIAAKGVVGPVLIIPTSKIDIATLETFGVPFTDLAVKKWLEDLDNKLHTLVLFS